MKNKKPEIRFKGFSEEWEECELKDLCTIITKQTGFDYSATIKPSLITESSQNTYSFIQNKDFSGTNVNFNTDYYIPKDIADTFPNILIDKPSILISISGKIGNVGFYKHIDKAFIGGAVGICKLINESDGLIILYKLVSNLGQSYFQSLTKASSHSNITVEDIRKISIEIPSSNNEKIQIGNFFKNLDTLITLHQQKYVKLVNVKKAMLEKMFPKNGSDVPEIRFKGFSGAWEERKLGEVIDLRGGRDYKHLSNGDIPVYGTGGYMLSVNEALSHDEDAIGIGRKGTIDKPYKLEAPFWTVDTLFYAIPIEKNNLDFIYDIFQKINWKQKNEATGVPSLSKVAINGIQVLIPKREEQEKIGNYFKNLDNLLTLHQGELGKLKNLKKAMLEKMFV